jgi:outer membrane protein TolC
MNYKKRSSLLVVGLALLILPIRPAAQEKPAGTLTLSECIGRAVKYNLGVAVQVFSSELADLAVSRSREKFLPTLSFNYYKQSQNSASYSWLDAAGQVISDYADYKASLSQSVPFGGNVSLSIDSNRNGTNARFQTINPRYGSSLTFSFTQPLLKDFGYEISRKDILVARNSREIAENDLRSNLIETVSAVERAYWELVYVNEVLNVQRQSLKLAEDLLDKSRKEADIGTLAPKEVLSAQAEVASRRADILQAAMQVKDQVDTLKGLINLPFDKDAGDLLPADTPGFVKRDVTLEEALAVGLKNRPDLQSSALGIKNKELDYSYAKNQTLPDLKLSASYWSPGVSGDQIVYQDNNPLTGIIVGSVPGGPAIAMRDALHFKYENWSVQLSLSVPMNSVFTRAAQAQAKAGLDQEIVLMKQTEQKAYLEIRAAVRAVQTNYERVGARKTASDLAAQKLEAEESKLKVGLSDNFKVLQYQRDLAAARTAELRALIDYTLSLGQLDKATGVSLEKRNIKLTDAMEVQR